MEAYTQEQMALYNALANCTVRMQSGDETAYNDIYNMMFSHVNALIKSRGISEDDCVDIAQETMMSVYKYINTINDPQSTYKWIMSLASNKIADYFRKNSERIENETYIAAEDEDDMGEAERLYNMSHDTQSGQISLKVPEDIFVNREKQQMLIGVVNSLKDEQKQIVMMHCFSDMTFKDIASALGVSENTVKTKFYRSLNKLESSIYEVEKREGVRLHTVGFVPFMLFLFMLYSQNTPICTQTIETVTNRIGKQITDMHNMAAQNAGQGGNNQNDNNLNDNSHNVNTPNADNKNVNTANNNYNANDKMKADAAQTQAQSEMNEKSVKGAQTWAKAREKSMGDDKVMNNSHIGSLRILPALAACIPIIIENALTILTMKYWVNTESVLDTIEAYFCVYSVIAIAYTLYKYWIMENGIGGSIRGILDCFLGCLNFEGGIIGFALGLVFNSAVLVFRITWPLLLPLTAVYFGDMGLEKLFGDYVGNIISIIICTIIAIIFIIKDVCNVIDAAT